MNNEDKPILYGLALLCFLLVSLAWIAAYGATITDRSMAAQGMVQVPVQVTETTTRTVLTWARPADGKTVEGK